MNETESREKLPFEEGIYYKRVVDGAIEDARGLNNASAWLIHGVTNNISKERKHYMDSLKKKLEVVNAIRRKYSKEKVTQELYEELCRSICVNLTRQGLEGCFEELNLDYKRKDIGDFIKGEYEGENE